MINIDNFFEKIKNKNILLAVSGGVDSMVMLDLFIKNRTKYNLYIEVAHFNHMTRDGLSDRDMNFVRNYTKINDIVFHFAQYSMSKYSKENKISEEEAGRILRHRFFNEIINNSSKEFLLALAHNKDDQVETILMRILRGTGIDGLNGMSQFDFPIIRPMLNIEKKNIIEYSKINNIEFVQDDTNFETDYMRNKIRNNLIPELISNYNFNLYNAIINLSEISRNYSNFINKNINKKINEISEFKNDKIFINKKIINTLSEFETILIVRNLIEKISSNYNFTKPHFDEIIKIIKSNKKAITILNDIVFYNSYDNFIIRKKLINELDDTKIILTNQLYEYNGFNIMIKSEKSDKFTLRKRKNGDRFFYKGRIIKLKDFLIDKRIDSYERDFIPLIIYENEIIAIGDYFIKDNKNYKVKIRRINE